MWFVYLKNSFFYSSLTKKIQIEKIESDENNINNNKENVTERLAAVRQTKFNQIWNELLEKISQLNQVFFGKL